MTREIGDILIKEVLDHNDYEVERKIKLIEKIEKLVMNSLNLANKIMEYKAEKIATEVEAKEMLENGATVRETQEATGLSYRKTAKISAEVHKQDNIPIRPTRDTKPITSDNNADNGNDNKSDNENDNKIIEESPSLEVEPNEQKEDKPILEITGFNIEDEKAIARKRLVGLTGLKRAAMAAKIDKYFSHKEAFNNAYKDDPNMKFAYTLDDYINNGGLLD